MTACPQCGAAPEGNPFACDQCGTLDPHSTVSSPIECENHVGQPAVAVCCVCGKPVCGDCALRRDEKFYCDTTDHITIGNEWVSLHRCQSDFEADLYLANLRSAGIAARFFSPGSHISLAWSAIDLPVRILVKRPDRGPARQVLIRLGLLDDSIPQTSA